MAKRIGLNGKLYYGTAGSTAGTEVTNARDVTLALEKGEADSTVRGDTWESTTTTLLSGSIEFDLLWDSADTACEAIRAAFFAGTVLAFLQLDAASGKGIDADFEVVRWGREEPLRDMMRVPVTIKPTNVNRAPTWQS